MRLLFTTLCKKRGFLNDYFLSLLNTNLTHHRGFTMTYDQVIENLEWLEDKGRKLSRYTDDQGSSIWVDHDTCEIVEDF